MSGRTDLMGGVSPIMVASHIAATTAAACQSRRRRKSERRAGLAAAIAWGALQ